MAGYVETAEQAERRRTRQREQKRHARSQPSYVRPTPTPERRAWNRDRMRRQRLAAMHDRLTPQPATYDVALLPWSTTGTVSVIDPDDYSHPHTEEKQA